MTGEHFDLQICSLARKHHEASCRSFAHVFHHRNTICIAPAFNKLPAEFRAGILLHELGHLSYEHSERHSERDADAMGFTLSGIQIHRRTYRGARNLEVISARDLPRAWRFISQHVLLRYGA